MACRQALLILVWINSVWAQWPEAWEGGDMVRIVNKKTGLCLTTFNGLTSGLSYWHENQNHTKDISDPRYNVQEIKN